MKKIFRLMIASLTVLLTSCSIQLMGTYPNSNHVAISNLTFDKAWSKAVDFFAMSGTPITIIDKESGIIISSRLSFLNSYTKEENGRPIDPNAYVVIPQFLQMGTLSIIGDWNVRIQEVDGNVRVNVNLVNLSCTHTVTTTGQYGGTSVRSIPIQSTGVFEKQMLAYLGCE